MHTRQIFVFVFCLLLSSSLSGDDARQPPDRSLTLAREGNWLIILGDAIPGGQIRIHYLEAYCRAGSTNADWVKQTVIAHRSELVFQSEDSKRLQIRDTLADGLVVLRTIIAHDDEVDFRVHAHNPTKATAWDSYQELFQGVARCLHSDLRLGGLQPGQSKTINGKIYVMAADVNQLLDRYQADLTVNAQSKASDDASQP